MSAILSRRITEYVNAALDREGEVNHSEVAEAFIADHGQLIDGEIQRIVTGHVRNLMKAVAQSPVGKVGQLDLPGMPAAITVADGVTKRLTSCTRADLEAGRRYKVDNIAAASAALKSYDTDMTMLTDLMDRHAATTVGEAIDVHAAILARSA